MKLHLFFLERYCNLTNFPQDPWLDLGRERGQAERGNDTEWRKTGGDEGEEIG